jgi:hypothetical protein
MSSNVSYYAWFLGRKEVVLLLKVHSKERKRDKLLKVSWLALVLTGRFLKDSAVSEDAGIESRTVFTLALAVRRSNQSARSRPLFVYFFGGLEYVGHS